MVNRIRELRDDKRWSQEELAEKADLSTSYLSRVENQKRNLSLEAAIRLADAFGVSVHDITDEFHATDLEALPSLKRKTVSPPPTGDIATLDIRAGMGGGGLLSVMGDGETKVAPEHIEGYWSFPDPVRNLWQNMPETYALKVIGDSMEPTIVGGSYAFVDLTYRHPAPADIYAVDYGDGLMVKRIKLVPQSDRVLVISDNPTYGTDEVMREDLNVYGRVVAWFHWKG